MTGPAGGFVLTVGGEPRVDLLPPEVRQERRARGVRRGLVVGVVGVIAVSALGVGAATVLAGQAQSRLVVEQARTADLLAQQASYAEVLTVQEKVDLTEEAQRVGVSTEIDWKKYLQEVQGTLPMSVTIDTVTMDSASPLAVYEQSTASLQGDRVATVAFTATSAALPDVPTWLDALETLPGFADALPGSVNLNQESGVYAVSITMHVNEDAFAQRFETKGE